MSRAYLITGATGFVGRRLLRVLSVHDRSALVYAIVRPTSTSRSVGAQGRAQSTFPDIVTIPGDARAERYGLGTEAIGRLRDDVTHVVNCAASIRFDEDVEEARRTNVGGTDALLRLARTFPRLRHFVHVSTAYVCGDLDGELLEAPIKAGRFRNIYEQTKWEAEKRVEAAMGSLPATIVRPSIVAPRLDDARAGFLALVDAYLSLGWRWVPGSPGSVVDLVPIDIVAAVLHAVATTGPLSSRWYHVAAGETAATLGELGTLARTEFDLEPLEYVDNNLVEQLLSGAGLSSGHSLRRLAPFLPYLAIRTHISTSAAQRDILGPGGMRVPSSREWFSSFLRSVSRRAAPDGP